MTPARQIVPLAAASILYRLFLHPLRAVPGPKLWAASSIPYLLAWVSGRAPFIIHDLHRTYGDVVRIGPNRLSFTHPDAWQEIRGHRKSGENEHAKDPALYAMSKNNILGASRADHARVRRILSHGFSAKSMQGQQPLIMRYVDLLMQRLEEMTRDESGQPREAVANLASWFNFTTFDIIGDLAFGEPFGCLEESRYHPWVDAIFQGVKQFGLLIAFQWHLPGLLDVMKTILPRRYLGKHADAQIQYARERLERRLAVKTSRPDFAEAMAKAKSDDGKTLTTEEMASNGRLLVVAGSETTATALSGAVYFLASHPGVQKRLAKEVRSSFTSVEDMNFLSVSKLGYLLAVLDEAMRMFPPVPNQLTRVCQSEGDMICGYHVPGGVSSSPSSVGEATLLTWMLNADPTRHLAFGYELLVKELH